MLRREIVDTHPRYKYIYVLTACLKITHIYESQFSVNFFVSLRHPVCVKPKCLCYCPVNYIWN
jgi:hypothetical protein